jgi:thiamine biosynthesis lipoprotein
MDLSHIFRPLPDGRKVCYAWFSAMHTRIDVALLGERSEQEMNGLVSRLRDLIVAIEKLASCFDAGSELARVNREAFQHPVVLTDELFTALSLCRHYQLLTGGLFDVTTDSDDFRPDTFSQVLLSDDRCLRFLREGIRLNLSGFLKGYALDKVRTCLSEEGITDALVNMGNSSVLALGRQPGGEEWKIGIPDHSELSVSLHDECLTTSGNDSPERRHIVDPRTGSLVEGQRSVSVVTTSGTEGEVLSTCCFIATPAECKALREKFSIKRMTVLASS